MLKLGNYSSKFSVSRNFIKSDLNFESCGHSNKADSQRFRLNNHHFKYGNMAFCQMR